MYLLTGSEELLLRRAAGALLDELRVQDPGLDVTDVRAGDLPEGRLPDLRTASLFGTRRAVVVREAHELPAAAVAELHAEAERGSPETVVVLLATRAGRLGGLAKRLQELGGRIDVSPPRPWEAARWGRLVADEFARHQRVVDRVAVTALMRHAGTDVPALVEKVDQVAATAPPGRVTAEHVERVVVGHGSKGSFAVADAMCDRQPARALELLRGVLEDGDDPVLALGALAYRLRSIVAVAGGIEPKAVGLNVSTGQARRLRAVRANFGPGELTAAYRTLAWADREIKGGELPPALVVERAVAAIATPA